MGRVGDPGAQPEADIPEASRKASCMSAMELKALCEESHGSFPVFIVISHQKLVLM
jgi:hypothetical protein